MKILFLSPRQCWPIRSGAKAREYHLLRALSQRAELDYAYFAEPGAQPPSKSELPDCRNMVSVPKPGSYTIRQKILGVAGKWPLPILNYTSPLMMAAVQKLMAASDYDLLHLDSIHMMRYAEGARMPVVYNWHNIESEAMRRFADTVGAGPRAWYARTTADKMQQLERRILARHFGHVVCSEREKIQLSEIEPSARIAVVENGVDTATFAAAGKSTLGDSRTLVFIGIMDYYPNIEAAVSFATGVWPSLRSRMAGAQLVIVGANPTAAVRNLAQIPGITVTGTVPDVRPYYENALAAIVPLRTGGGTRLKILEAMAAGVPVVSTPLGAEGLEVTGNTNILLADSDDAASWIGHIGRLSESLELRTLLIANALQLVKARYEWKTLGRKLCETYEGWLQNLPS